MIKDFISFLSMGGHGLYIWLSYMIPLVLIISITLIKKNKLKEILRKLERNEK